MAGELSPKNDRKCVFSNALWIEDLGDAELEPEVMVMGRGSAGRCHLPKQRNLGSHRPTSSFYGKRRGQRLRIPGKS